MEEKREQGRRERERRAWRSIRESCLGKLAEMEKAVAPHSSTLAWKIPWTEEPGGLQSVGSRRVGHDWVTSLSLFTFMHWRRNGTPLQCSCLENPRDGGAWWAAVYGVTQSWTRLKWLSSSRNPDGASCKQTNSKKPACQCRRPERRGSIPEWGRSPGGLHGNPLQCSCLKNPMDRGAWQATVHRVSKSW